LKENEQARPVAKTILKAGCQALKHGNRKILNQQVGTGNKGIVAAGSHLPPFFIFRTLPQRLIRL